MGRPSYPLCVMWWEAGTAIKGYILTARLGRGGFGEVWEARRERDGRILAIKRLHPDLCKPGADPTILQRFVYEAQLLMRLEHPGVVRIEEVIDLRQQGVLAYVMQRLRGQPLNELDQALSTDILIHCFHRVAEALAYLHAQGIIHRDIKASNIFVCAPQGTEERAIKLIDLGAAKGLDSQIKTKTGVVLGTLKNMAPECFDVIKGRASLTASVDQWAFGVALFRLMTGRMPFVGDNLVEIIEAIQQKPVPDYPLRPQFSEHPHSEALFAIASRCMEKRPQDRFSSLEPVAAALENLMCPSDRKENVVLEDLFASVVDSTLVEDAMPFDGVSDSLCVTQNDRMMVDDSDTRVTVDMLPLMDTQIEGSSAHIPIPTFADPYARDIAFSEHDTLAYFTPPKPMTPIVQRIDLATPLDEGSSLMAKGAFVAMLITSAFLLGLLIS